MQKAAVYIRLSVEDEDKTDESESIKNQRLILTDYAEKMGWSVYKIYCDEDFSGLDNDRPEFKEMIKAAEKGLFDIVLCKSQSRFTRDIETAEKYINRLFHLWGIRFVSLTDNIDSFSKGGRKTRQINSLVNEWYCEDLSESVNAVFRNKMKRGEFIGSFAPYGYKKTKADKNKLEIDNETGKIVAEIFNLYTQGNGMKKIAGILTERKIPTPTQYKLMKGECFFNPNYNKISGEIWSAGTIRNILKNPVYIGDMVQGKTKKLSYKSKKVTATRQEDRITAYSTHEGIVSKEVFRQAADIMKQRRFYDGKSGISSVMQGKIKCGVCGESFIRGSLNRRKTGFYYICSLRNKSGGEKCTNRGLLNTLIEEEIFNRLKEMKSLYIGENTVKKESGTEEEIKKEREKIRRYESRLERLYFDYSEGILDKNEFAVIKNRMTAEKNNAEKALKAFEEEKTGESRAEAFFSQEKLPYILVSCFVDEAVIYDVGEDNKREIIIRWKI